MMISCNGSCPIAPLFAYIQNSTISSTITITGIYSLPLDPTNNATVLTGAFVPMQCNSEYVLASGQLNITCLDDGWTEFPICVSLSTASDAACVIDPATTFSITNGYYTNYSLSYTSNTTATGSIQFACGTGFALDPTIGASYVCNNGQWSTKPQCLSTGRCSFSQLQNFITSATGTQIVGQPSLLQLPNESDSILIGSYIVLNCIDGYANMGGNLNITCDATGSWSPFPNCVSNTGTSSTPTPATSMANSPITTPIMAPGNAPMTTPTTTSDNSLSCIVDPTSTFSITNGYYTNYSLSYTSNTTATGSIQFACGTGFALDPTIGASYVCNNGQWSTKPQCLSTGRCLFSQLQNFLTSATGTQIVGQPSLLQLPNESDSILIGSYIVLNCIDGYANTGGSLNVTCDTSGSWSPFPNCAPSDTIN